MIVHPVRFPSVGSGSFSTTLFAVPGPVLVTRIENVGFWPIEYVPLSGVLLIAMLPGGGVHVVEPLSVKVGRLVPVRVAVLVSVTPPGQALKSAPPTAVVVTVTDFDAPCGMLP